MTSSSASYTSCDLVNIDVNAVRTNSGVCSLLCVFFCCSFHFPAVQFRSYEWYDSAHHTQNVSASLCLRMVVGHVGSTSELRLCNVHCSRTYGYVCVCVCVCAYQCRCFRFDSIFSILWAPGKSRALLYSDTGEKAHL